MSMFLDSSRTLPDIKEGLGNPDMSGILLDSPTLLLSWPTARRQYIEHSHITDRYFPVIFRSFLTVPFRQFCKA
jgi:hypothetical protein